MSSHPEVAGLEQLYTDDGQGVALRKFEIIRLWEMGIFSDLAYLYLLLRYEFRHDWKARLEKDVEANGQFDMRANLTGADIDHIAHSWQGITPKNDRGDVKELTYDKITKAIAAMHSKECCVATTRQLTLRFDNELGMGL